MASIPQITMHDGARIPQFGFGVFQIPPDETADAVRTALDAGYRHIDTAQMYRNEEGVAEGIKRSGVARDDIFITTKLNNDRHGHDSAIEALDESLRKLGTDHVDLFLIHWPQAKLKKFVETWKAFEKLAADGRARSIGVSNFEPEHLETLANETDTVPAVNQIELHPGLQQAQLRAYHREHGIITEAWSPLAQGKVFGDQVIVDLAQKHDKSPAQVVLRWHIQLGNVVFPKSSTPSRVRDNIDVFDFELSDEDMAAIGGLDRGMRIGPHPASIPG
jgi:2,5-diketo-D-gluconate reductase A